MEKIYSLYKIMNSYQIFTGIDQHDDFLQDLPAPLDQIQILLYRINTTFAIPYVEVFVDNKTKTFPLCSIQEIQPSRLILDEMEQENWTNQIRNQLFHYLETHIFQQQKQFDFNLPKFKGFYQDPSKPNSWFVFYNMTKCSRPLLQPMSWQILEQISLSFKHDDLWTLYLSDSTQLTAIHTRPIRVYGTNSQYLRTERAPFGTHFFFKLDKDSTFSFPHLLFLPPIPHIFTIQKDELQNIAAEILQKYDFSEEKCIHYTENQNKTWCIKNILSFFPTKESDSDSNSNQVSDHLTKREPFKSNTYQAVFGNQWP